jgi:protein-L-isoaspartate(D-aspartate) O-methyltransferase
MEQHEPDKTNVDAVVLNRALVDELKKKGLIQSPHVEAAFRAVLRHLFLPETPLEEAYSDRAISAKQDDEGKWISSSSQPAIMAIMLEQLDLQPGHNVLEIGTGPGYNAALMAHIVGETGRVVTIEIDEDLTEAAREHLSSAGFAHVQAICADGGYGYPDAAPFDRIILTVGAPDITPSWWSQMKPDGRLVLPLLLRGSMKSIAFKQVDDHLASLSVHDCGFISLRGDFASTLSSRVQVGPDAKLYVEPMEEFAIDSDVVYDFLTKPVRDWGADVEVTAWDVLGGSLWTWLALHEPHMCKLVAEDELVEQGLVPPVIGIDAKKKSSGTAILLDQTGLAGLMRSPDQPLPMVPFEKLFNPDSPATQSFALFVRQFGGDESVAARLLARIQAWKAAGCPSSNTMHVRAYPRDVDYKLVEEEILLEKPWTKLIIEWTAAADKT